VSHHKISLPSFQILYTAIFSFHKYLLKPAFSAICESTSTNQANLNFCNCRLQSQSNLAKDSSSNLLGSEIVDSTELETPNCLVLNQDHSSQDAEKFICFQIFILNYFKN